MVSIPSKNVWMRRQQCPCRDWKCFVTYEGEAEDTTAGTQLIKNDSASSEAMVAPYVGMVFKSDDEAFDYYSNFARKNGFSIRKERSRLSPQLGIYKRDFVCYRSGYAPVRKKPTGEHHRDRKSVRCGCDAKMYLSKEVVDGVSQWFIVQFSNVHNHELLEDDQVRLLPAYRKIHEADQERILLLSKAGFPVHRIVKVLELEKGIHGGQLPFLERDVRNFVQNRKKIIQENDALLTEKRENDTMDLLEACKAAKDGDAYFVYDVTVDENDKVENIAWSNGDSVHAYTMFGDVVYFDTTYRSIKYGMLFAALLGIDNYGKIIFFGCALLQDESHHSFAWALQMVSKFGLESDKHAALLFSLRSYWVSSYTKGFFVACMATASYLKSVDAFLKGIFDAQTCLRSFFEQVAIHSNVKNYAREEMQYMHIRTCLPMEKHARNVLTPFIFKSLQHELVLAMQYSTSERANKAYLVRHFKNMDGEHLVVWIPEEEHIQCSCKEFESTGILCRHALRVLLVNNYFQLPERYLLSRWRQHSSLLPFDNQSSQNGNDDWFQEFHSLTGTLFTESSFTKQRSSYVREELRKELTRLISEVRDMPAADGVTMDLTLTPTG
ncbi:hypothetical protein RJ639_045408 [Escallonia herrerae]|uniref:Protein FAR1-RELATED SEQUENCE n=1 Tax=Escallonia herrerae TaxID=1293975 RepID=A0AA88W9M0_9ASTE|nr:hypothetical protein RJ639_045408 [Escallonia herrerae]